MTSCPAPKPQPTAIHRASLQAGISYGGFVAYRMAVNYPER